MQISIRLFCLLLAASTVFTSCSNPIDPSLVTDEGVVIGSIDGMPIRWATRNVDAPGTFAPNPESAGMLFQWNRAKGWNNNNEDTPRNWNIARSEGTTWYAMNDPCPKGWRVPTVEELRALRSAGSEWTELNGVRGHFFGTEPNRIFLPAAGRRRVNGVLVSVNGWGHYWSSTPGSDVMWAWHMQLHSGRPYMKSNLRINGFSVRCVAE